MLFILLVAAHYVGDFLLQSHSMAINKCRDNAILAKHAGVYAATMTAAMAFYYLTDPTATMSIVAFGIITFALHFGQDYVTSRMNAEYWAAEDYHRVMVTGVAMSQHLDNFIWGPEVITPKELGGEELYEGTIPSTMPDTPEIRSALQEFVNQSNHKSTRRKLVEKIIALVAIRRDHEDRANVQ